MSAIPSADLIQNTRIFDSQLCEKNGVKRIYLESNRLNGTRFEPGVKISVEKQRKRVVITPAEGDTKNAVSRRRSKPVIDIYNKEITEALAGVDEIKVIVSVDRIVIEALEENVKQNAARSKFKQKRFYTMSEMFGGGGTLAKAFKDEGFIPVTVIEREERYIQNYERNFPGVTSYCMDVRKVDYSKLPHTDIAVIGIPCDNHSQLFTTNPNNKDKIAEAGATGYLTYYALRFVEAIRPAVLCVEEVVPYISSVSAIILRKCLEDMGYHIWEDVLSGQDFGSLTSRRRYCMVASMKQGFKLVKQLGLFTKTVGDILEEDGGEWLHEGNSQTIRTFKAHVEKQRAKGNCFRMETVQEWSTKVPTVTRGYYKFKTTNPILKNGDKDEYRFFTPRELASIHGLPSDFILPEAKSTAGECVGQGIVYEVFNTVAKSVKRHLREAA